VERKGLRGLRVVEDVSAADWIRAGVESFGRLVVGSLVPAGFEAYARVFHPAYRFGPAHPPPPTDRPHPAHLSDAAHGSHHTQAHLAHDEDVEVRWEAVAEANGRRAHAGMQWPGISGFPSFQAGAAQPGLWDDEPETGSLPIAQATDLLAVLRRFTGAEEGFCAVWDGFGALSAPLGDAPRVDLPARPMVLLHGPLADVAEVSMEDWPWQQSPSLCWPADRAWCVATDVDQNTTYLGASRPGVEAVLAEPRLEVWSVTREQSLTGDSDEVNAPSRFRREVRSSTSGR
jgi:hypothetical protein